MTASNKNIDAILVYPNPTQISPIKGTAMSIFYPGSLAEQRGFNIRYFDERFDSDEYLINLVKNNEVLSIGISTMTGFQITGTLRIMRLVKKINPRVKIILGGVHPSLLPEQCMLEPSVDFIVMGEGEITFVELLAALRGNGDFGGILGLSWRDNGRIVINPPRPFMNPAELPFPLTEKNRKYFKIAADSDNFFYFSSRGCPHQCRFCYNLSFNNRTWRSVPIEKFESEIDILYKEFGFHVLFLNDDNIGSSKQRLREIVRIMNKHNISWGTCIRCDQIDDEVGEIISRTDCDRLLLGIESGSGRVLNEIIGKKYALGVQSIKNCSIILNKYRLNGVYSFMCGIPGETDKELMQSLDLADWIHKHDEKSRISFHVYAPYPGTQLFEVAFRKLYKEPKKMEEWREIHLSSSLNPLMENYYYISGLNFRRDVTAKNFPGLKRLLILPFEILIRIRWKARFFRLFAVEKRIVKFLIREATRPKKSKHGEQK